VTSVDISTTSPGLTVGGGPITGAGTLTVNLDADLNALAALSGTNTIYYRSGAATWSAVTVGNYLSFAAGTLDCVPPTATNTQSAGAGFAITAASGTYQATGLTVSTSIAGTYLITAKIRGQLIPNAAGAHYIVCKLRNNSTGTDVTDSETMITLCAQSGVHLEQTAVITAIVSVAGPGTVTFEIYAKRFGTAFTLSSLGNDTNGRTLLNMVRLA